MNNYRRYRRFEAIVSGLCLALFPILIVLLLAVLIGFAAVAPQ